MIRRLWSFRDRYRILHLTWFAFFLSFVVWFNIAPLATTIQQDLRLTTEQLKVLAICNLALTIPARIVIGMILDRFGPRLVFESAAGVGAHTLLNCCTSAHSETYFLRHYITKAFGIKTGLGVPIVVNAQVISVLVFFQLEICEQDPQLIELAMAAVQVALKNFF